MPTVTSLYGPLRDVQHWLRELQDTAAAVLREAGFDIEALLAYAHKSVRDHYAVTPCPTEPGGFVSVDADIPNAKKLTDASEPALWALYTLKQVLAAQWEIEQLSDYDARRLYVHTLRLGLAIRQAQFGMRSPERARAYLQERQTTIARGRHARTAEVLARALEIARVQWVAKGDWDHVRMFRYLTQGYVEDGERPFTGLPKARLLKSLADLARELGHTVIGD